MASGYHPLCRLLVGTTVRLPPSRPRLIAVKGPVAEPPFVRRGRGRAVRKGLRMEALSPPAGSGWESSGAGTGGSRFRWPRPRKLVRRSSAQTEKTGRSPESLPKGRAAVGSRHLGKCSACIHRGEHAPSLRTAHTSGKSTFFPFSVSPVTQPQPSLQTPAAPGGGAQGLSGDL